MNETVQDSPDILKNMPGEQGKRYVVREEERPSGIGPVWKFTVFDRQTRERVASYGTRVGANHLAFGLNVGWDITAAISYASGPDRWASQS